MSRHIIVSALERVHCLLRERPEAGPQKDPQAIAVWSGGMRVVTRDAAGREMVSDMPSTFGGEGAGVTPGWLFNASLAACAASRISADAALAGVDLTSLEVTVESRSDIRGLFDLADEAGAPVSIGPSEVFYKVSIAAQGDASDRLRALVESACATSPNARALRAGIPVHVEIKLS